MSEIASLVDRRICELLDADASRWSELDPELAEPFVALKAAVVTGGKRLRAAFCFWAFVGHGGERTQSDVIDVAAAVELLHAFALIHDDVMDGSDRRRGNDALHVTFERRHLLGDWRGDSRRFGEAIAILLGDLAFVYSDLLLSASAPPAAVAVFNELRMELTVGQYLDLTGAARRSGSREDARRISHLKSGKYTVERPLHLGAALAQPDRLDDLSGPLSDFGLPLGEAFQLKDDLLGVFGDSTITGKPTGDDLRGGKATLLHALARESATGPARRFLVERFGAADLSEAEICDLQTIFDTSGARRAVEDRIDLLLVDSLAACDRLCICDESRDALSHLAVFVAGREH